MRCSIGLAWTNLQCLIVCLLKFTPTRAYPLKEQTNKVIQISPAKVEVKQSLKSEVQVQADGHDQYKKLDANLNVRKCCECMFCALTLTTFFFSP